MKKVDDSLILYESAKFSFNLIHCAFSKYLFELIYNFEIMKNILAKNVKHLMKIKIKYMHQIQKLHLDDE